MRGAASELQPPLSLAGFDYGDTVAANTSVRFDVFPEFAWTKKGRNVVPIASSPS
jgi:hypothetical protein